MAVLLIAIQVPIGVRAAYDVLIQKPRDITYWQDNEQAILEARGMTPGSASHKLFDRRARSNDATGPFGFANPLGSIAAGGAVLAGCIAIGGVVTRQRRAQRRKWTPVIAAGAAGFGACVTAAMTHSAGAQAALILAGGVVAGAWLLAWWKRPRWISALVLIVIALAFGAVLMRGAAGPPDSMAGERSLLFRFHYWQAAQRVMADQFPGSALFGTGQADFAQGYLIHKNPMNPEDVQSAHSVFVDYIVMLGVGGAALSVLLLAWLIAGARAIKIGAIPKAPLQTGASQTPDARPILQRPHMLAVIAVAAAVFGTQFAVQSAEMTFELRVVWLAGLLGFVAVATLLGDLEAIDDRWLNLGLLGSAAALLIHGQIEMTFFTLATIGPATAMIALAGSTSPENETPPEMKTPPEQETPPGSPKSKARWLVPGLLGALVVVMYIAQVRPIAAHQKATARAASHLQAGRYRDAIAAMDEAGKAIATDSTPAYWIATLHRDEMHAMDNGGLPTEVVRQAMDEAMRPIDALIANGSAPASAYRTRAALLQDAAELLEDKQLLAQAAHAYEQTHKRSPYHLTDAVTRGDLYVQLGRTEDAKAAYTYALWLDAQLYLDDAKQLDDSVRQRLAQYLQASDAQ